MTSDLPSWVVSQHKTFIRWINTYLKRENIEPIKDLRTDLASGIKLIQLLEIIGDEPLGRYNKQPRLQIHKVENLNTALDFIKHRGIKLHNIGAEDIIEGNLKLIFGLLWILILRFTISGINEEGLSAKEGLLLWCQRKTAGYPGVKVKDFSTSWTDGLAFCALLDYHRPDLLDFDALDPKNKHENVTLALKIATEQIGIPQLLDVEDICMTTKDEEDDEDIEYIPDERSIMTYVAYWFHAFSEMDRIETAGRRLEKFVEVTGSALSMKHGFEQKMASLIQAIKDIQEEWTNSKLDGTYADVKSQADAFANYKVTVKRAWITEKSELVNLLGNIRIKLATYQLKPYSPPQQLSLEVLEQVWRQLIASEAERSNKLNSAMREIKEILRKNYANTANEVAKRLDRVTLEISKLEGSLETQLLAITKLSDELIPLTKLTRDLKDLDDKCNEAKVEENDYTVFSYAELEYELDLAKKSVVKKLAFIENQIIARNMNNLTPVQLEEFESAFRYFDKSHSNCLQELEFSGALASLGLVYNEEEMHQVFMGASEGQTSVSFEKFINFMVEVTEDQQTADQVFQSFQEISSGKEYVTELDLRSSLISDKTVEHLTSVMPEHESRQGFDYTKFMRSLK